MAATVYGGKRSDEAAAAGPNQPCARAHDLTGGDHVRGKTRSFVLLLCALCALLAAGIVASSAAAKAKSHNVHMKITKPCAQKGTRICGTYGGSPFGTCKMTGTLQIPKSKQTWKCPKGNITVKAGGTTGPANDAKGTWKMTGGTKKNKHIRGSGTFSGKHITGVINYIGKAMHMA